MSETPSANGGSNGQPHRDGKGRFLPGHPGGPGNPHAASASARSMEFWREIKSSDIKLAVATIRRILRSPTAKDADKLAAARELLDRTIGPARLVLLAELDEVGQALDPRIAMQRILYDPVFAQAAKQRCLRLCDDDQRPTSERKP